MLISSGLVLLMVPAMCLFYSGASNRRTSLTLFRLPLITAALIGFQVCQNHKIMPSLSTAPDFISGTSGDIA
jgi:ammonia channel protein AmtB